MKEKIWNLVDQSVDKQLYYGGFLEEELLNKKIVTRNIRLFNLIAPIVGLIIAGIYGVKIDVFSADTPDSKMVIALLIMWAAIISLYINSVTWRAIKYVFNRLKEVFEGIFGLILYIIAVIPYVGEIVAIVVSVGSFLLALYFVAYVGPFLIIWDFVKALLEIRLLRKRIKNGESLYGDEIGTILWG